MLDRFASEPTKNVLFGMKQYAPKKEALTEARAVLELFVRIIRLALEACIGIFRSRGRRQSNLPPADAVLIQRGLLAKE
jgi:hypothetical protein